MAACRICGCSNWFFSVSERGLCRSCDHLASIDIDQRARVVLEASRLAEQSGDPRSKIEHMGVVVRNLEALTEYERRGIATLRDSAEARLIKSRADLDELVAGTARRELEEVLDKVRETRGSCQKTKLYSDFLIKLLEHRAWHGCQKPIEALIGQVRNAIYRVRLNAFLEEARHAEFTGDGSSALEHYRRALGYWKRQAPDDPAACEHRNLIEGRIRALERVCPA
ncbi:MAG: hypothetical protein ABII00_17630 [Elusimicrobiota bacterium]